MRWKHPNNSTGDKRQCSGFLFFPKTLNGETRWLEHATWFEGYVKEDERDYASSGGYWSAIDWV